jgi:hypothetical protein
MSKAVFSIILDAENKEISTESLFHIAAAVNISVSGDRNLRFKVHSVIGKHAEGLSSVGTDVCSSASIADFLKSFESYCRPILLSIAALHCIQVPANTTNDFPRSLITQHLLPRHCSQFSRSYHSISLPDHDGLSLPDCTAVHNEWLGSKLEADLQMHILMAIYGSKISLK